jgi:DNA repair protein RadC
MKIYKNQCRYVKLKSELNEGYFNSVKITSSAESANYIRAFFQDSITIYESVFLLMLNRANNTIAYSKIGQGGVSGTVLDPKIVLKFAIDTLASNIIIAHNHPSGQLYPSSQDDAITTRIKNACNLIDVNLLDHIILTENNYYSYADNNKL